MAVGLVLFIAGLALSINAVADAFSWTELGLGVPMTIVGTLMLVGMPK